MKDIKSDVFGLLIAFFAPGVLALYGLTFYSTKLSTVFATFLTADSNVGLFLIVSILGLIVGLQISVFRWLLFEKLILKNHTLNEGAFKRISANDNKLLAFRAGIDEHYRYHQLFGALFFITPEIGIGLIYKKWMSLGNFEIITALIVVIIIMTINYIAAVDAYKKLIDRSNQILK